MAWVERTFAEVDPPEDGPDEDVRLGEMLRNLPPYMKLTTRRARKALEKYELMKQRHIENLRQNPPSHLMWMKSLPVILQVF